MFVSKKDYSAVKEYGQRIRAFRKTAELSQKELATFTEVHQPYIAAIENGDVNIGIKIQETIGQTFGVRYYQLADPEFPIPSKEILRDNIRRYLISKQIDPAWLNEETPNLSHYVDRILNSDFLDKPRTAKAIAQEIATKYRVNASAARVTDILSRNPRRQQVQITKSENSRLNIYRR